MVDYNKLPKIKVDHPAGQKSDLLSHFFSPKIALHSIAPKKDTNFPTVEIKFNKDSKKEKKEIETKHGIYILFSHVLF